MTVPTEACGPVDLGWTGSETQYAPGFRANADADVRVISIVGAVQSTLTNGFHYTVTRALDKTVTVHPVAANMPAPPATLRFLRHTPAIQGTDFENLASYSAETHEDLHDAAAMRAAELRRDLGTAPPLTPPDLANVLFPNLAAVEQEVIDPIEAPGIFVAGGEEPGDGLAAWYVYSPTEPASDKPYDKVQSANGFWFERVPDRDVGSSTTPVAIGAGSKTFQTQAYKDFAPGRNVKIISAADHTDFMGGTITAYDGPTGALTVDVTSFGGGGTHDDWDIYIAGVTGVPGPPGASGATRTRTLPIATIAHVNLAAGGIAAGTVHNDYTLVTGDLVLVNGQNDPAGNGIYPAPASGAATRHPDYDTWTELVGLLVVVTQGTDAVKGLWRNTNENGGTLETSPVVFEPIVSGAVRLIDVAGTGAAYTANAAPAIRTLTDNTLLAFTPHVDSEATPTIAIPVAGTFVVKQASGRDMPRLGLRAGTSYLLAKSGTGLRLFAAGESDMYFDFNVSRMATAIAQIAVAEDVDRVGLMIANESPSAPIRVNPNGSKPATGDPSTMTLDPGRAYEWNRPPKSAVWIDSPSGLPAPVTINTANLSGRHPNIELEFERLIARFPSAPGAPYEAAYKTLLTTLMSAGIWQRAYHFMLAGGPNVEGSLLDWMDERRAGSIFGTVTHHPGSDFQGDGTTGGIDLGFAPQLHPMYSPDDVCAAVFVQDTTNQDTKFLVGNSDATQYGINLNPHDGGAGTSLRLRLGAPVLVVTFVGTGAFFAVQRRNTSRNIQVVRDAAAYDQTVAHPVNLAKPSLLNLFACCSNSDAGAFAFSTAKYGGSLMSRALTQTQLITAANAIAAYYAAVP